MEEELPAPDLLAALMPVLLIVGGIVIVVILILGLVALFTKKARTEEDPDLSTSSPANYLPYSELLSPAESRLYEALVEAAKGELWVFPKIRLANILRAEKAVGRSAWQSAFNRIAQRSVDFTLCIPGTYQIVALVELDDGTLDRGEQQKREQLVDEVTASAGIPVLHIQAESSYDPEELAQAIRELTAPPSET